MKQLDKCFAEAAWSIRWLENYTGIAYPFSKYDFVVLPGYQFGGMEHPGAIQFNARTIFLGAQPTEDDECVASSSSLTRRPTCGLAIW